MAYNLLNTLYKCNKMFNLQVVWLLAAGFWPLAFCQKGR